ncbi:MAG: 50S ribosomal protein L21 [Candidatus Andersenbacteria bacterium]
MKTAVIKSGGKQYLVEEGKTVKVDKLTAEEGKKITFEEVLLTVTDKTATVGVPLVKGATVEAEVVVQGRHLKVTGVKMKAKKRHKKYFGHKQHYTEVKITKIAIK